MNMEELFERDDELKRLIREEGLLTTSPDFTRQVMQLVKESDRKISPVYKPLLSRKAWFLLVTFIILLIVLCWRVLANENPDEMPFAGTAEPVLDFLNRIDLTVHINTGGLLIATIAFAIIGLLLSLDIWLSYKYREAST